MPEKMNRKTFTALQKLGNELASQGGFTQDALNAFGSIERIPRILIPLVRVAGKMPVLHSYWDNQLKANSAFSQRFARPYEE